MGCGRLPAIDVERGRLDQDQSAVASLVGQHVGDVADDVDPAACVRGGIEPIERAGRFDDRDRARGVDAIGRDHAAVPSRGDRGQPPREIEPIGHFVEKTHEASGDVAKPDQRERELGLPHGGPPRSRRRVSHTITG